MIAVFVCLFINTAFAQKSYAAIAGWGTEDQKSIIYGNTTYEGPKTNNGDIGGEGWQGGGGEIYFSAQGNKNLIIYFPKGTELNKDRSIGTSGTITEKDSGSTGGILGPRKDRILNSGQSITILPLKTSSALSTIQPIYKDSISGYASSLCADRNAALRSECQTSISNKFDECWSRQVESRNFSFNPEKPGDSVNIDNLASCIANETKLGSAAMYREALTDARDKANTEGLKAYNAANPGDTKAEPTSCAIDGIGWIICPVSNFLASLVDNVFGLISGLLEVKVVSNTVSNSSLRDGWSTMLNIANVAFVIAFMVIIYSQLIGGGITNYTIKRMLPRLVMSAILVNLSFWICAIAVDISNILGYSTQDLLMSMRDNVTSQANQIPTWEAVTVNILSAGAIAAGIGGLAFGALTPALMYGLLGILWPLLIAAIFSVLIALIILTARQAIIVILIVISPLAFVAFLLPNTEKWFTRWRDLFATMLFLFPIISLVFGGSQYAAALIMASSPSAAVIIMALAVQVIPLALTPLILKFSGGLLSRIGGIVNNPTKGPLDRLKNAGSKRIERRQSLHSDIDRGNRLAKANQILEGSGGRMGEKYSRRRRAAAYIASRGATGDVNLNQKQDFAKAVASESAQEYFAKRALSQTATYDNEGNMIREGFAEHIAGADKAEGLKASAQSAVDKIIRQDSENREILYTADIKIRNNPGAELEKLLKENPSDTVGINALGSMIMKGGSSAYGEYNNILSDHEKAGGSQAALDVARKFISDNGKTFKEKDPSLLKWAKSVPGYETVDQARQQPGGVSGSDEEVARVAPDSLRRAAAAGTISVERANSILNNEDLASRTPEDNLLTLKAVRDSNAAQMNIPANLSSKDSMREIKNQINRINGGGNTSQTVVQPQSTPQSSPQSNANQPSNQTAAPASQPTTQSNPTTLNIPHGNVSTTQPVNVNITTTPIVVTPPASSATPPAGRRSSGAPVDQPGSSTRENTGTRVVVPPDNPTNTDINRFI